MPQADDSDGDSIASILSRVDENETEVSQSCRVDDVLTSEQEDDTKSQGEQTAPLCVDLVLIGTSVRQRHKYRRKTDYIHKRKSHLPAVTLNAVRSTDNPNHPNARVSLLYDETMGVSVFVAGAPLRRNDQVTVYSVKESLTGDQYHERYLRGASTLTNAELWDKDYIIKYDNDMHMIGDHTGRTNLMGIAQYLDCAIKTSGYKNNSKIVKITVNIQKCLWRKLRHQ